MFWENKWRCIMHDSWTSSFFSSLFSSLLSSHFRSFSSCCSITVQVVAFLTDFVFVSHGQSCGAVLAQLGGLFLVSIAGNAHGGERGHTKLAVGGPPDAWPKARRDGAYSM